MQFIMLVISVQGMFLCTAVHETRIAGLLSNFQNVAPCSFESCFIDIWHKYINGMGENNQFIDPSSYM